jgi:hypothetical protein
LNNSTIRNFGMRPVRRMPERGRTQELYDSTECG